MPLLRRKGQGHCTFEKLKPSIEQQCSKRFEVTLEGSLRSNTCLGCVYISLTRHCCLQCTTFLIHRNAPLAGQLTVLFTCRSSTWRSWCTCIPKWCSGSTSLWPKAHRVRWQHLGFDTLQRKALTALHAADLPDVLGKHSSSQHFVQGAHHVHTVSCYHAGMGSSQKVDVHLVVNVADDVAASERDICSSPTVASVLRSDAAAASHCTAMAAATQMPGAQQAGPNGSGAADAAAPGRGWATALGEAATGAAASLGDAQAARRTIPEMRAEMAHRLALEYAAQYRCGRTSQIEQLSGLNMHSITSKC